MSRNDLQPGTRIWYTGDMANIGGYGTIIKRNPKTKYSPETVDILLDDPRFDGDDDKIALGLWLGMFEPSPGRRFMLATEYDAERKARIQQMLDDRRELNRRNA